MIGSSNLWRLTACAVVLCVAVMCQEEDGRENSKCDQHQRECMPINVNGVLDGVFEDLPPGSLDNAVYCLKRCVHPVDLRSVMGPRMLRLNWDLMEAKLAEENYGAMVDFDQFRANERQSKEAKEEGGADWLKEKSNNGVAHGNGKNNGNNGNAFGKNKIRTARQAGEHDDTCLIKEIGSTLEEAVEECQSSQSAMIFKRNKRDTGDLMHERQVKVEQRDVFMLKYKDQVIDAFCPHNKDLTNWCINSAMMGSILPTEFAEPDDLKALYCAKHQECNQLSNGCIGERTRDVVEMCKCFRTLYDKVQASTCPGAKTAFDRLPGQCSDKFIEDIETYKTHVHESCTDNSPAMSSSELIEFLGGKSDEDM